jgi:hypothetical protein
MLYNKKSQAFSIDAIIALIIFIVIFLTISKIWDQSAIKVYDNEIRNDFEIVSRNSFEKLLSTTGNPNNWHLLENTWYLGGSINRTIDIGLISFDNKLDLNKLNKLKTDSYYNDSKKLIGFFGPKYEYNIKIEIYQKIDESILNLVDNFEFGFTNYCSDTLILNKIRSINKTHFALIEFRGCIAI